MKKLVSFMLAGVLAVSLAACGSSGSSSATEDSIPASSSEAPSSEPDEMPTPTEAKSTEESSANNSEANSQDPASGIEGSLEEIITQIYEHTSKLYTDGLATQTIDMTDADTVQFLLGLTSAEGVAEAAVSEPMISSDAYSLCLVKVEEGADIDAIASSMREGVDPFKWICVGAEKVITATCGNYILLVMSSEEIAADVYEAFRTTFGESVSEAISR